MKDKKGFAPVMVFVGFIACLMFWPLPLQLVWGETLSSFLAYGIFAFWMIRHSEWKTVAIWCALSLVISSSFMSLSWAVVQTVSLLAVVGGLTLVRRHVASMSIFISPWGLFRLLASLALVVAPAATIVLFGGYWLIKHEWLSWLDILLLWGGVGFGLTLFVPLAFVDTWPPAKRWLELSIIILVAMTVWSTMVSSGYTSFLSVAILFFSLILWASFRVSLVGAALSSAVIAILLSMHKLAPGWAMYVGTGELYMDEALQLACAVLGLIVAVLVDTSRRNEQALQEFRARVESMVDNSPTMMSLKGLDGRYLLVNKAYAYLAGVSPYEMVGKQVEDFFGVEASSAIRQQDEIVLNCLESRQFEEVFTLGAQTFYLLVTKFPLFDASGRPAGVGSVDTDITCTRREQKAKQEAEQRYQALIDQSLVGIYILQQEVFVYVNSKLEAILGYPAEELLGGNMQQILLAGELPRIKRQIASSRKDDVQTMHFTTRTLRKNGEVVDVEVHSRVFDYQGKKAIIGVVVDISDRVAADANLKLAAKVFENSAEGILILDAEKHIIAVNEAFTRITGFSEREAIGKYSRIFRSSLARDEMLQALSSDGHWQGEMADIRKNGEGYPADLSISIVKDGDGVLSNYVAVFSDVTVRKQAEERLQFLANHDPLTRLPNRSSLIANLGKFLHGAVDKSDPIAVMFIDLDRFKLINDSFGHQTGDELLREISDRLLRVVGERGMLARLGGDEFTLIVKRFHDQADLAHLAEQILSVLGRPMFLEEHEVYVTGSIGISVFPTDGQDAKTLLKNADVAMYRAKESGKNTYQFFDAEMNAQAFERLVMENGLRQAMERGEFELYFQPQVFARSRALAGVEVLIRWHHPQWGVIAPGRFIPLAEETGLIKPIGNWVLEEACRQIAEWDQQGIEVPRVAVNLSARQFEDATLLQNVTHALQMSGVKADRLELELTESMIMHAPAEATHLLKELKSLGVWLSIDDFGTGYSSLSYLKKFPLDTLKIDRSFVDGLPADVDNAAIAEAVLAMARKLQLAVVAEGVENAEQADFLADNGCEILQGYHFGKPVPSSEFPDIYRLFFNHVASDQTDDMAGGQYFSPLVIE